MNINYTSLLLISFIYLNSLHAQVGIGTTTPDASAVLEVESTTQGFLPPRLSTADRATIVNPSEGLVVYNTTVNCLQWYVGGNVWHNACGGNVYVEYVPGSIFCIEGPTDIVEVTSPSGAVWMDRNLGASQKATSFDDEDAYGSLFQWGRAAEGHQCRTSTTTSDEATTADANLGNPWDGTFIANNANWLNTNNTGLWQGVSGINNPCPNGFRLPTMAEWNNEKTFWATDNLIGAFNSSLALPAAGVRSRTNGNIEDVGIEASYWSQDVTGTPGRSNRFRFNNGGSSPDDDPRGTGSSIRCIMD